MRVRSTHNQLLYVALGVALILSACGLGGRPALSAYLAANQAQLARPYSVDDRPVRFTVEPGMAARTVGQRLEEAGLIGDALLFEAYVRVNGLDAAINAGTFILSPSMTMVEIVELLQHAEAAAVTITLPEGWRSEQVADYLDAAGLFQDNPAAGKAYRQQVATSDLSGLDPARYPFLQQRPAGVSLEGYLFPDTYEVPAEQPTAVDLLQRQLDNFSNQVATRYAEAVAAGQTSLSLYEVLTVASIVEREAVVAEERPAIAGVYLNRLAAGMKLEADPTVQYAMGYQPASGQWWKTPVFLEEYSAVDSPYNTYLYGGLPPGPICNPGLSSIEAVLQPAKHDYLYFVALPDGSGRHVFATTFEEHSENVRKYLQGG
ncbi:MAG TPA: endolytic transglycosylase MltG [Caldilineaceae bacterium]|nr:endolytic transglycosylase MltG [Caldilineaceae bacterium]